MTNVDLPEWVIQPVRWLDENHAVEFTTASGDTEPYGCILWHRVPVKEMSATPGWCAGGVNWKAIREWTPRTLWELVSLDPLHVEPSIRCGCGEHGWIRNGKWVQA